MSGAPIFTVGCYGKVKLFSPRFLLASTPISIFTWNGMTLDLNITMELCSSMKGSAACAVMVDFGLFVSINKYRPSERFIFAIFMGYL